MGGIHHDRPNLSHSHFLIISQNNFNFKPLYGNGRTSTPWPPSIIQSDPEIKTSVIMEPGYKVIILFALIIPLSQGSDYYVDAFI